MFIFADFAIAFDWVCIGFELGLFFPRYQVSTNSYVSVNTSVMFIMPFCKLGLFCIKSFSMLDTRCSVLDPRFSNWFVVRSSLFVIRCS